MSRESAPEQRQLASPDVAVLWVGDEKVGWTRDHRIGFTGFADANTAGAAAWIAHVALARRGDRDGDAPLAMSDVPPLSVVRSADGDWIWGGTEALARLIPPGSPTPVTNGEDSNGIDADDARRGWWSIEVELPALSSELDVTTAAYVIQLGLAGSGLAWELQDALRDRARV